MSSVLFSEPQSGVFVGLREWLAGAGRLPRVFVPVATSIVTTGLVAWAAVRILGSRVAWDDTSRLLAVFAAVLLANATMSYVYTKDEIVSIAGVFYALAVFAAMRELLPVAMRVPPPRPWRGIAAGRARGRVVDPQRRAPLRLAVPGDAAPDGLGVAPRHKGACGQWPEDPSEQRLILQLRTDAVELTVPNTRAEGPRWVDRYWGE